MQPGCGKPLEMVHQPQRPPCRNLLHARQSFAAKHDKWLVAARFFDPSLSFRQRLRNSASIVADQTASAGERPKLTRAQMRRFAVNVRPKAVSDAFDETWSW
jgi:hypothetical protein